ncbi:olfactory receptor 52D1-like [Mauremys reevesii]|uniref:olfactory receptor 52D1-like n=1 Tax=Mauremys reevesii TaxID=260615 RepID=UPI00193F09DB|nr:olfactory receptor 52D1-like [Mauremys reevesii]
MGTLSISESYRHINHLMAAFNLTPSDPSTFILMGIPGLEASHLWISIPFSMFYIISLLGNFMLLSVVATLVTMAFDRYVAICNPLIYATILSNARIAKLGLVGLIRAILFILPLPLFMSQQLFCANRIIPHTQCKYTAVFKMACGDITVRRIYGLVLTFVINGFDLTLIALSYGLIIRAVLRISSKNAHQKALNTCTTHICVMLTYYTPGLFSNLTYRLGQGIAPHVHIILANLYLLIPPMLNPIIYGIRTKELHDKVGKYTCCRR